MTMLTRLYDLMVLQTQGAGRSPDGGPMGTLMTIGPIVLMFLVIYLLMIRPANKQRREHAAMLNALKKDDEVITSGGLIGKVFSIDERVATIEVGDKVKIRVLRDRISGRWNPVAVGAQSKDNKK